MNLKPILDYAREAHKGQKYGNGKDYFEYHILGVAEYAKQEAEAHQLSPVIAEMVAILHDILEDTDTKLSDLIILLVKHYGSGRTYETVLDAVKQITKEKDEGYYQYIKRLNNEYALIVKAADLAFNIENSYKGHKKLDLYMFAVETIGRKLGSYQE